MTSQRTALLASIIVCCLAAPAAGTVTITAGNYVIVTNRPGQVIHILISSDVPQGISSADLGLEIGVGGPVITSVDMTSPGTIFGDAPGGHAGQFDFEVYPTQNQLSSIATTSGDTFPAAGGVLAKVTLDTSGIHSARILPFNLIYGPFFLPTSTSSIPFQQTVLVDGSIFVSPEPSSLWLGLMAGGGLGLWAMRRRRMRGARPVPA